MFLRKRKSVNEFKDNLEKDQDLQYFKEKLSFLIKTLIHAYITSTLKWYEMLIIVIVGVLGGVGAGLVLGSLLLPQKPVSIIIPLNRTHIIEVSPP